MLQERYSKILEDVVKVHSTISAFEKKSQMIRFRSIMLDLVNLNDPKIKQLEGGAGSSSTGNFFDLLLTNYYRAKMVSKRREELKKIEAFHKSCLAAIGAIFYKK